MIDIFERIKANNPWWVMERAIEKDSLILEFESRKFRYYHPLLDSLPTNKDAVLTLRGPRRVGKSTLVRLIIRRLLLKKSIAKEAVFFYPCDRLADYNDLFEVIKSYLDFARPRTGKRLFLFLDEISFVKDWQRAVKEMVDTGLLKDCLVLLTGSSILDLKFGSEYLSGRRGIFPADIFYNPLSFKEFIALVDPDIKISGTEFALSYHMPKLHKLFEDYLLTGGFPTTINEYYTNGRIDNSTYETFLTWIENDLHKSRRSEQTAYDLIANIIRTITTPVSFTSLAKDSLMASHFAVQEYLDILEKMFILFTLPAYWIDQKRRDPKKNKKIYFSDPFIFNALYLKTTEQMEDPFSQSLKIAKELTLGKLAEVTVAYHLRRIFPSLFWGKLKEKEIDFAAKRQGKVKYFEVKYRKKIDFGSIPDYRDLTVISQNTLTDKPMKTVPLEIFLLQNLPH